MQCQTRNGIRKQWFHSRIVRTTQYNKYRMNRYCYQFIFIFDLYVYSMFDYVFVICRVAVCKNENPRNLHRRYRQRMRVLGRRQLIRTPVT